MIPHLVAMKKFSITLSCLSTATTIPLSSKNVPLAASFAVPYETKPHLGSGSHNAIICTINQHTSFVNKKPQNRTSKDLSQFQSEHLP